MTDQAKGPGWVWAIIETEGREERLSALEDEERGLRFIPVFSAQEDGVVGLRKFPRRPGVHLEVEAMHLANVAREARAHGYDIFILDYEGKVLERLSPALDS
ncbi:MAG: hypothetical protein V1816_18385 [Pseudomonadota bacterium]